MEQKTVFISYRRSQSKHLARSIYQDLKSHGWDVFLDVNTIDSGDFDRIILNQIGARAHFILLISPGSLERCTNPGDWLLREIQEAVRLGRNIVPIIEEGVDFTDQLQHIPQELREAVARKNGLPLTHFYFEAAMDMLRTRFLKAPEYVQIIEAPESEQVEIWWRLQAAESEISAIAHPSSMDLMPAPFAWINIPGKGYSLAKYPVTNTQFAKFIEAGGYDKRDWWLAEGWDTRKENEWTKPRFWDESQWNGAKQPVVGVSWYEAMAFCHWLGEKTQEKIMLPTEDQWHHAAQGDDGRIYPWGNIWDCKRCNNSVEPCKSAYTKPVNQYEGLGDSPFGVVDMAGNVWEWCLTNYDAQSEHKEHATRKLILRGGSWGHRFAEGFRCKSRYWGLPKDYNYYFGFRLARAIEN